VAVISFHSLEDGVVKTAFKDFEQKRMGKMITEKPIQASGDETKENPRSKSAKLRVFQKN
jgi:16S rRNA (cytosine1402-N4)-methyltransferase